MRNNCLCRLMRRLGGTAAALVLLLSMGGCPVNTENLITDVVDAALASVSTSLVEALTQFLAQ